jgi:hypothetical protein
MNLSDHSMERRNSVVLDSSVGYPRVVTVRDLRGLDHAAIVIS